MICEPNTIRDLIALWPSRKDLTSDLQNQGFEVTLDRVHKWAQLGSIPAKYHQAIAVAARWRDIALSAAVIARLHHAPDRLPVEQPTPNHNESSDEQCQNTDAA